MRRRAQAVTLAGAGPSLVAAGVYVVTSPVYLTTTTIVIGDGGGCLLIDPALTAAEIAALGEWLAARGVHPVAGWATHAHWDHVLWGAALGAGVPRYGTAATVAACQRDRNALIAEMSAEVACQDLELFGRLAVVPGAGDTLPWAGPRAQIIAHDAHAPGHGAIYLPEASVLVAGDMVSDVEIPLLDLTATAADPLGAYRAGLRLLAAVPGVRHVVPGHGHVTDAAGFRARVAADLHYLDLVEAGRGDADPRLHVAGAGWLRAEHARQAALRTTG
jgi:glyoxylase-like metal-dependent hydrolase (beta-lactamase superfamily II)